MLECLYKNETDHMVILKCVGINQYHLEKVVMPTESFLFEAPAEARIEIWQMSRNGKLLHRRAEASDYIISPINAMASTVAA